MGKFSFAKVFKTTQLFLGKHSPEILTGVGVGLMGYAAVSAARVAPKAAKAIEDEKTRQWVDKLSLKDTVKVTWKHYAPSVASGVSGAVCIFSANRVRARRTAALSAAYTLSESTLREYKEKVLQTIGEKKAESIQNEIDKQHLANHPVSRSEVILTNGGNSICFDAFSKRYFYSDHETIRRIQNDLNEQLLNDISGSITLNELYYELGLEPVSYGDDLGWFVDRGKINIHIGSGLTDDNRPCLVIDHINPPGYGV